jgi:hypothetical protein
MTFWGKASDFFIPLLAVGPHDEAATIWYPDTAGRLAGADNRHDVGTFSLDQPVAPWFLIPEPTK